jgi:hypothetical protein
MLAFTEYGLRVIGNTSLGRTWELPPRWDIPYRPGGDVPTGPSNIVPSPGTESPVERFVRRYGLYILLGIAVLSLLRSRRSERGTFGGRR